MDVINFPGVIEKFGLLTSAQIDQVNDLLVIGKKVNNLRDGSQYEEMAMTVAEFITLAGGGVQTLTGYNVNNTDPVNPVILPVVVNPLTISGTGVIGNPFSAIPIPLAISATNYYVDATFGNNGTALPNRFDRPYLTIASALAAAPSGTPALIYVRRGAYTGNLTVKNLVNFYFESGCTMSSGSFRDLGATITCKITGYLQMTGTAIFDFTGASTIFIEMDSMSTTGGFAINVVPAVGTSNIFIKARFINATVPAGFSRFINIDRQANLTLDVSDFIIAQRFIEFRFLHNGATNVLIKCPRIILPSTINAGAFSNPIVLISASSAGIPTSRANLTINGDISYTGPDKASEYLVVIKDGNFTMNGDLTGNGFSGILYVGNQGILPPPATTQKINGNIITNKMAICQNHSTATVVVQQSLIKTAGLGFFPYAVVMGNDDAFPPDPGGKIFFKDCRIVNTNVAATGVIIANNGAGGFGEVYTYNCEMFNTNAATGEAVYALAAQNSGFSNTKSNVINDALITNLFGAAPAFVVDSALIIPQF